MRYSYLRGPGGRFRNPYDHGVRKNCSDFFLKGYNEDIERVVQAVQLDEEMGPIQTRSAVLQSGESTPLHVNGIDHSSNDSQANSKSHRQSSAKCCNPSKKSERTPLGLGLGLGRNNPSSCYVRSLLPLWIVLGMQMCYSFFIYSCMLGAQPQLCLGYFLCWWSVTVISLWLPWHWNGAGNGAPPPPYWNCQDIWDGSWELHESFINILHLHLHTRWFFVCRRYSLLFFFIFFGRSAPVVLDWLHFVCTWLGLYFGY